MNELEELEKELVKIIDGIPKRNYPKACYEKPFSYVGGLVDMANEIRKLIRAKVSPLRMRVVGKTAVFDPPPDRDDNPPPPGGVG